ncbi:hypothetical protein SAMN05216207_1006129 [Pseudonocardia ammonioxydans]|uniref:GAF domain-containing protein n=1 Tax=Pseudonocardia ammonioxydans TaxID=260086 RepID=A0A1I4VKI6_PSUAM|nr:hypothetical protein [Pseudonocardia ammonioxydans]SFN01659.1 hypothetical protein SAMN05216207_1006129 [Pseudonocardia ammonioxydans]
MAASQWSSGASGRSSPDPGPALVRVALQAGATSVAHLDVAAMLSGICVALVPAARVAGAALLLHEPADPRDPEGRRVFGSDTAATRLADLQVRADAGPGPAAGRGDRALFTPDLTRSGPPGLAAAAADLGLVRSLSVPVPVAGRTAGVLQLVARGGPRGRLDEQLAGALAPVVAALGARLADIREFARLEGEAARAARAAQEPVIPFPVHRLPAPREPLAGRRADAPDPVDAERTALVPAARRSGGPDTGPRIPAQRRARHRRDGD